MQSINVATLESQPWIRILSTTGNRIVEAEGTAIRLMDLVLKSINISYQLVMPPDRSYGAKRPNGSWTGMLGMFLAEEAALIPHIGTTYDRTEVVRYAMFYQLTDMAMFGSTPPPKAKNIAGLVQVFNAEVWLGILLSFCVLTLLTATRVMLGDDGKPKILFCLAKEFYKIIFEYISMFLFEASSRTTLGFRRRTLHGVCWLSVLILMNGFCGHFRAKMMQRDEPLKLRGLSDLDQNERYLPLIWKGSIYEDLLGNPESPDAHQRILLRSKKGGGLLYPRRLYSWESFLSLVSRRAVILSERTSTMYALGSMCKGTSAAEVGLYAARETVLPKYLAFALHRTRFGPQHLEGIDRMMCLVQQSSLLSKWMNEANRDWDRCTNDFWRQVPNIKALGLEETVGILYIYLFCLGVSCLTLMIESTTATRSCCWFSFRK